MNISITDFDAVGDGSTLSTVAINAAIDHVHRHGGGMVTVPPGTFLTGMLRLRDHVELHLQRGAVLKAAPDLEAYLPLVETSGCGDHWPLKEPSFHLILALGCRDVGLTGPGRVDGNGTAWYTPVEPGTAWPLAGQDGAARMGAMVLFSECIDVTVRDVELGNVCNWTLHLHECDRVRVRDVMIQNPAQAPNSDGIDITGCRGVTISGCHIDTGDDAICLKTLPGGRPCEDVTVGNCVLRTHCVAMKLGAGESFQDMRNIVFSHCVVRGSHRVIGLYSLEGAVLENVSFSHIVFDTRTPLMFTRPIHIDLRRRKEGSTLGSIRNISISDFMGETNGRCLITAEDGAVVENLLLRDVVLRIPVFDDPAIQGLEHGGSQFSNRTPHSRIERAAFVLENVRGAVLENLRILWPDTDTPPADWTFATKLANGTHKLFHPSHWTLPPGTPVHAVSLRQVENVHVPIRDLDGWRGGEAVHVDEYSRPLGTGKGCSGRSLIPRTDSERINGEAVVDSSDVRSD
jgi:hypothetical protein